MFTLVRLKKASSDFNQLTTALDKELAIRDGDDHAFYHQFNSTSALDYMLVLYLDQVPAACGAIAKIEDGVGEIKRMYTLDKHRGQGLASRVLAEIEAWAAELSFSALRLETGKKQPEAISLYCKRGFERIPNYDQYKGVEDSLCFQKALSAVE